MKLLLDQNVSYRLVESLSHSFPGTAQVGALGMGDADDRAIWEFARLEGFAIVTHDADFEALSVLNGGPPLVVWLRFGNQPRAFVLDKLLGHVEELRSADSDPEIWCIEIY